MLAFPNFLLPFIASGCIGISTSQAPRMDGVTFAGEQGRIYVPLREAAKALGVVVEYKSDTAEILLGDRPLEARTTLLFDGTRIVPLNAFRRPGVVIEWNEEERIARIMSGGTTSQPSGQLAVSGGTLVEVLVGRKKVMVDKSTQLLRAWQGDRVVFETVVSTGRRGHTTPNGTWAAREKFKMHYSKLYDNSPMPWSVHVVGNIFIHGYHSVPSSPASHGCVRVPIYGKNPAKWFYDWVEVGTPITIEGDWSGPRASLSKRRDSASLAGSPGSTSVQSRNRR